MPVYLALIVLAAVPAGCGARGTVDPVASAATKSQQAGGVKVAMTVAVAFGDGTFSIDASGVVDRNQGRLTFDMSNLLRATNLPSGLGSDMKAIYRTEDGDPVLYMNMPLLSSMIAGRKAWIRLDLQHVGSAAGIDFNQLLGQTNQNPAQVLDLLRAAGRAREVGPAMIDGAAVMQYHATVDLNRALKLRGISESAIHSLLQLGAPTDVPVDVWIGDNDGLVHQLQLNYDLTGSGKSVSTLTTIKLTDWGTDVSVEAPPADEVFDATDVVTAAGES